MHVIQSEFYGDKTRWFIATVVDNSPPEGLEGKVKVAIKGIHSQDVTDIPYEDLPWADVLISPSVGGSTGHGVIPRLVPYTLVYGIFLDGELSQQPLVMGQLHTTERPSDIQLQKDDGEPYELPEPERALIGKILSYGASLADVSADQTYYDNNATSAGYEQGGMVATGVINLTQETDFPSQDVMGQAVVYNNNKLASAELFPYLVTLNKSDYSLNYIGLPKENAEPEFDGTLTQTTASSQNAKITGQAAGIAYNVEAITVGAPQKYIKALFYINSNYLIEIDEELKSLEK